MKKHTVLLLLFLNAFLIYIPHLITSPVMLDDDILIKPIQKISSISEYIEAYKRGDILDIQPIRDLSYFIDIYLNNLFGVDFFLVLSNILILAITAFSIFTLLLTNFGNKTSLIIALLFLNHPNTFHIYVEPTSRKHILSFLFFLLAYLTTLRSDFIENNIQKFKGYILFLLSILSCPISLNLSVFFLAEKKFHTKKGFVSLFPFFIISLILGLLNIYYYQNFFLEIFGFTRTKELLAFVDLILIFGLFLRQTLFPFIYSTYYITASLPTLIFTVLSPILLWLPLRQQKNGLKYLLLMFLIFFTLYGLGTSVIYLNTYSLFFMFGVILYFSRQLDMYQLISKILLIVLTVTSLYFSYTREHTAREIYERQVEMEPNCRMIQFLILDVASTGESEKINKYGKRWLNYKCRITSKKTPYFVPLVLTYLILHNPELSISEKVELFNQRIAAKNDIILLKADLFIRNNQIDKLASLFDQFDYDYHPSIFLTKTSHVQTDILKVCSENKFSFCSKIKLYIKKNEDTGRVFGLKTIKPKK